MADKSEWSTGPRQRILDAARSLFEDFGFRRASIADIAREAGVSVGTLYRYFENKEDIFLAVMRQATEDWVSRAREILSEPGSAIERLARLGRASVEYNKENRLLDYVLSRDTDMILAPLLDRLHDELTDHHVAIMASVVRQGIEEGSLRNVDPERAAFILFIAGHALFDQKRYPYEEILPLFAEIVMGGLVPR